METNYNEISVTNYHECAVALMSPLVRKKCLFFSTLVITFDIKQQYVHLDVHNTFDVWNARLSKAGFFINRALVKVRTKLFKQPFLCVAKLQNIHVSVHNLDFIAYLFAHKPVGF